MIAEVISIGDELTSGQRLDTNSRWLSQQLGDLGIHVLYHTTVGDDMEANKAVFQIASERVDVVVCTGGLGPTADDLTRQAIAEAFGLELFVDSQALAHVRSLFAKRNREMPVRNEVQAQFPVGALTIDNPHGTAPGIDLQVSAPMNGSACRIFALPGVPAEMREMYQSTVVTRLRTDHGVGSAKRFFHVIKMFGIGESDVEAAIPDLIARDREPRVGLTVSRATITLRITATAAGDAESLRIMQPTIDQVHEAFGELIFGRDNDELQNAIARQLTQSRQSVSVLEIGPEVLAGAWLQTSTAEGIVAIHSHSSVAAASLSLLESSANQADSRGQLLEELGRKIRALDGTDWTLVIGPYPAHAQVRQQVGLPPHPFHIALLGPDGQGHATLMELGGHPDILYHRMAKAGLDVLRRALAGLPQRV
jgi:nicotinamide-nucleotide amidase